MIFLFLVEILNDISKINNLLYIKSIGYRKIQISANDVFLKSQFTDSKNSKLFYLNLSYFVKDIEL